MLRRDFMPRAYNAALEKREGRFHGISVNIAVGVFAGMVNGLVQVLLHVVERVRINSRFIRHNHFDVTPKVHVHDVADSNSLRILSADQSQVAIALANPDNHGLVARWTPTTLLASNVSFVNLYCAAKRFRRYFQHGSANPMCE